MKCSIQTDANKCKGVSWALRWPADCSAASTQVDNISYYTYTAWKVIIAFSLATL